ncbi:MAG: hypothetical protein LCH39_02235 [Proteobacteria bacterium]|nr:hypothetical protein [Pseudomonadota bacterium]
MQGTTFATIGEGRVVIGGQENPLAQGTINRDITGRQIVTVNEGTHFTFDIPLVDFNQLSQNATSAFNLMQALTTPVPDDVAAMGDAATDYYRRLIAQGATPDVAQRLLDDEQVQKLVSAKDRWDRAVEYWGGPEFVPEKLMLRIARGDNVDITDPTAGMECGAAGTAGPCFYNPQPNVSRESVDAQTKAVFGEAAEEYKQIYARIRTAYEAGTAPNPDDLYKLEIQKEVMKAAFAANALCRGSNMGMWSEYLRQFGLGELGNGAQMDLGRYLNAGALQELGYAKDQSVRGLQSELGTALKTAVHLTPVAGAIIDGYNLYQDLSTGQYYAAGVDGALLALNLVGGAFIVRGVIRAGERIAVSEGAEIYNTAAMEALPRLRQAYVSEVVALAQTEREMVLAGASSEEIAIALHARRRELGEIYKDMTPPAVLERIYERNLEKYGDRLGPTIEWLRAQGRTWDQIIQSAKRPGGKDLGF